MLVPRLRFDPYHHFPGRGKFNGITDYIQHDLAQTQRITHKPVGNLAADIVDQFQALFVGASSLGFHQHIQTLGEGEFPLVEGHFIGLDLGKVENVVE